MKISTKQTPLQQEEMKRLRALGPEATDEQIEEIQFEFFLKKFTNHPEYEVLVFQKFGKAFGEKKYWNFDKFKIAAGLKKQSNRTWMADCVATEFQIWIALQQKYFTPALQELIEKNQNVDVYEKNTI